MKSKQFLGVYSWLSDRLELDVGGVRIIFLLGSFFYGVIFLIYFSLYILKPKYYSGAYMQVVILAGGYGTRIGEETLLKPKPMICIGGAPPGLPSPGNIWSKLSLVCPMDILFKLDFT